MNNAMVYHPILKFYDYSEKSSIALKDVKKKDLVAAKCKLAAIRLYSVRLNHESVRIALTMDDFLTQERRYHGGKIVPMEKPPHVTRNSSFDVIEKICNPGDWKQEFDALDRTTIKREPFMISLIMKF